MANKWYFARDGKTHGPYSVGQLRGLAATGQLRPRDTVWKEGMENRVVAARVRDLFTLTQLHPPAADATPLPVPRAAEVTDDAATDDIPDDVELVPLTDSVEAPAVAPKAPSAPQEETGPKLSDTTTPAPAKGERRPNQQEIRKRRVLGVKGGLLLSQDGTAVRFRKKCLKCGQDDNSVTTMQIPPGFVRLSYFCPKCKKCQQVEVQGVNS